ncbi:Uncharacterized protein APZ42_004833 [Daphnia magna]|uniref:HAT C-terminal dimerisation domain-containing protein n=1 Tax=Daphnia magna TaxID=35525 RepID=A0A164GTF3_9CRUS|nr:Uncharacterized protein APZ42_004833 [Daphnia magna]
MHFSEIGGKQSKYHYCKSTFVVNGTGTITTMSKHIYTKHPNKIDYTNQSTLDIKGTVASSERAFSAGKDVFGIARMSLNPETVEALVCLRSWYRAGLVGEPNLDEHFGN